jgi:glycosyltransferase involved in cell wall biosynthesis
LPLVVSDIPAHREIGLDKGRYFSAGNAADLRDKLRYHLAREMPPEERRALDAMLRRRYDWQQIAARTVGVYRRVRGQGQG